MSLWTLDPCRSCKGIGALGTAGLHTIYCEDCEGTGLDWAERQFTSIRE